MKERKERSGIASPLYNETAVNYAALFIIFPFFHSFLSMVINYGKEFINFSFSMCMTLVPFQLLLCTTKVTSFSCLIILTSVQ